MKVLCKFCGAVCLAQSDWVLNGSDDLYACPNGHTRGVYEGSDGVFYIGYWPYDEEWAYKAVVSTPECPVCHRPFEQPTTCGELTIVSYDGEDVADVIEDAWYTEHEFCRIVWAGKIGNGAGWIYKNVFVGYTKPVGGSYD